MADISVEDARAFLNDHVGEESVKGINDDQILDLHGMVSRAVEKSKGNGEFPEDWRERYVTQITDGKGDEKLLGRLQRYTAPNDAFTALFGLQDKVRGGELKSQDPFPKAGTDEQKAQWRKDHNVPDTPDKYEIQLKEGHVIGEDDKPIVDSFTKSMHENNVPQPVVNAALQWYYDWNEKQEETQYQIDEQIKQEGEDKLRLDWGADYRKNIAIMNSWLDGAGAELKELILSARLGDRTPFWSNPAILKFFGAKARDEIGDITVVPGEGAERLSSVNDEIKSIQKLMGDKNSDYWKGPKAKDMQDRYLQLISARDKLQQRGK